MTTTLKGKMRGSRNAIIEDGQILRRQFVESYIVLSDDGTDDEGHVYNTAGVPSVGDAWAGEGGSTNPGTYCIRVSISDSDESKRMWIVEAEYNSELPDGGGSSAGGSGSTSPQDWSPEIEWTSEKVAKRIWQDINGNPIVNPVFEYYEAETFVTYPILRYSRWQTSFTSAVQIAYMDTINDDVFLGYAPGMAKMEEISARASFIQGLQFWWVTYVIKFDPTRWLLEVPVKGSMYFDTVVGPAGIAGTNLVSAQTETGLSKVNLNQDGTIRVNAVPLIQYFVVNKYAPFNPLVLGP